MKSLKVALVLLVSFMSVSSFAAECGWQQPYIVLVRAGYDSEACADAIDLIKGAEVREVMHTFQQMTADLSPRALLKVGKLGCVENVQPDRMMYPQPAIGGSKER